MKRITRIEPSVRMGKTKLRVAAYARVSTLTQDQLVSLEAQKNNYETRIKSNPDWEYAGLYYDEGISGLNMANRNGLNTMLSDCEEGKIDLILIKSISRFARNTAECLEAIRKLIRLNVFIHFEKENINTGDMDGELLLTIFSSLAESESRAISENGSWSVQKRFQSGTYISPYPPYGYKNQDGQMVIAEEEAEVVRLIFSRFLAGQGAYLIAKELNEVGLKAKRGGKWAQSSVSAILTNETYKGDSIFQKTYTDSNFTRHTNKGERPMYYVQDHHEPIITPQDFQAAQTLKDQRGREMGAESETRKYQNRYPFTGKVICGECGATWKRQTNTRQKGSFHTYACNSHLMSKDQCSLQAIKEKSLEIAYINMLGKLKFSMKDLLQPLLQSLEVQSRKGSLTRINEIEAELDDNLRRREQLLGLFTKEYLDPATFTARSSELMARVNSLNDEKDNLVASISQEFGHVSSIKALMKYLGSKERFTEFDEEGFAEHVDRVIVFKRDDVGFALKCGLTLKERL